MLLLLSSALEGRSQIVQVPDAVLSSIAKTHKEFREVDEAVQGDLNGDGMPDIAVLIKLAIDGTDLKSMLVFFADSQGRFSPVDASDVWPAHDRRSEYISIKAGSLYFSFNTGSYTDYSGTSYQFKFSGNAFRLIGTSTVNGQIGKDATDGSSTNLGTHETVTWNYARGRRVEVHTRSKLKSIPLRAFRID